MEREGYYPNHALSLTTFQNIANHNKEPLLRRRHEYELLGLAILSITIKEQHLR